VAAIDAADPEAGEAATGDLLRAGAEARPASLEARRPSAGWPIAPKRGSFQATESRQAWLDSHTPPGQLSGSQMRFLRSRGIEPHRVVELSQDEIRVFIDLHGTSPERDPNLGSIPSILSGSF
jgi:hypothetical protein